MECASPAIQLWYHGRMLRTITILICVMTMFSPRVGACIWDYDTLRDERRGLPGVSEALAGRFEKRSEAFYLDRVARMEKHLAANPDDEDAIDNYAVALFRIGKNDRAIEVMIDKEQRFPDRYTTSSNLATFYMLRGDSAAAIPLLEKALSINPNAHFGREEYQLQLARFLVTSATQPANPLVKDFLGTPGMDPIRSQAEQVHVNYRLARGRGGGSDAASERPITAIVGMIRFGTENSPDLYYALGNLLAEHGEKRLAVRAYLRAIETGHPQSELVRKLADEAAGVVHPEQSVDEIDAEFKRERDEASRWVKEYQEWSMRLIEEGKDPDDENNYRQFYRNFGPATTRIGYGLSDLSSLSPMDLVLVVLLFIAISATIAKFVMHIRKRRRIRVMKA